MALYALLSILDGHIQLTGVLHLLFSNTAIPTSVVFLSEKVNSYVFEEAVH